MKELFMVDQNTLFVLIGLFVFVVFVVIYKSKQQGTTYHDSGDNVYDDIDDRYYDLEKDIEEFTAKQEEKFKKVETYKRANKTEEEKATWFYIDLASISTFSLILYIMVIKQIGILGFFLGDFGISIVIMTVLYYLAIKPAMFNNI